LARQPRKRSIDPAAARREADEAIQRAIMRDRYTAGVHADVISILQRLQDDVIARLATFNAEDASARVARLTRLKREVGDEIAERYRRMAEVANGDLSSLATDEAIWKQTSLRNTWHSVGLTVTPQLAPPAVLNALISQPIVIGGVASEYWRAEGEALTRKFSQQMQIGIAGGESTSELIKRVRGADGIMALSFRNAEAVVRTSVNSVANAAHMATYQQNADVIEALQHYSVLDMRTTVICAGRHGRMWDLEDLKPIGHELTFEQPPIHWRCRSIIVSVLDRESNPPAVSFDDWFKSQTSARQDQLFGPGRAQLFRDGRISQKDLLSNTGAPISLSELRKIGGVPSAPPSTTTLAKALKQSNVEAKDWVLSEGTRFNREHLVAIDDTTGEIFDRKMGTRSEVVFSHELDRVLSDPSRRITIHHNHPDSTSLSLADLQVAHMPGSTGVWAHGHNGSSYFARSVGSTALDAQHLDAVNSLRTGFRSLIKSHGMTKEEAVALFSHLKLRLLQRRGHIHYEYTLSDFTLEAATRLDDGVTRMLEDLA
jgi:SPP1 gp7 family putative phage head morphogenesis protein